MRILRKLFLLTLLILGLWGGIYTYNQVTDGFSIRQMTSSLPPYPQFEVVLAEEQKEELQKALAQPYRYLGKGCQFYAFESADGRYVLKFLKHKHLRPYLWLNRIPMPSKLRAMSDAKITRRQKRAENLFSSCKLAYEGLSEETGLLFVHLNRTPALESEVVLIDKLGFTHRVAVDAHEYVVQRKAVSVKEVFESASSEDEVRARVEQLIAVVRERCEKGIADRDRSFVQNVAFCVDEPRAIFIDTGQFYPEPAMRTEEAQIADLKKRLNNLHYWTGRYFPEYLPIIEEYIP